jgi:hypothetical protein
MALSPSDLAAELTSLYTDPRVVVLLDDLTFTGDFIVDTGVDPTHIVFGSPHKLVTNSRTRLSFSSGGGLPGHSPDLLTTQDYHAIFVNSTTIQLTDVVGGTAFTFTTNGAGTLTATEQELSPADTIPVLVNHEVSHPDHVRFSYIGGTAVAGFSNASLPTQTFTITIGGGNPSYTYKRVVLIRNGTTTVGNTTGDRPEVDIRPTAVIVAPGATGALTIDEIYSNA